MPATREPRLLRLSETPISDAARFGGKALGLAQLVGAGLPVPPAFLIPPTATREECQELFDAAAAQPEWRWIVRSSAAVEDSKVASFAGLFESIGELGADELWDAIARCRRSAGAERVQVYLQERGLPASQGPIPLVAQRYIEAQASGVAFSLNPHSGRDDELVVEAVRGPGEPLVSGRVTPYRWTLARDSGLPRSEQSGDPDACAPLNPSQLAELHELLLEAQARLRRPLDIEWVWDGEAFALVQARPITALADRGDVGEWTNADFRDGGVAASSCTRFMSELYEVAVERSMTAYFRAIGLLRGPKPRWMGRFFARPYWNLGAVKDCLRPIPGFREADFDRDLGIDRDYGPEGPSVTPTTLATLLPALPVAARLEGEFILHRSRLRAFLRAFPELEARAKRRLGAARESLAEAGRALEDIVSELQQPTERAYFRTIYNSTNLQGEFKKGLEGLSLSAAPDLLALLGGLGGLAHLEAELALDALARLPEGELEAGLRRFFADFGYRGTRELDISAPRWAEDEGFIREHLARARAASPSEDPQARLARQRFAFERERERIAAELGLLRGGLFRMRLAQVRDYLWVREQMRDASTRAYALTRQAALGLGRQLAGAGLLEASGQVFDLSLTEALAWSQGQAPASSEARTRLLRRRRQEREGFADFEAPGEVGVGARPPPRVLGEGALRGIGCSPGLVEAPAFVALSVEAAAQAPAGSVLVARFTDPGWTPVFARLAAVVTEVGGLLSHAAVLAREYGIPAVLAVPSITRTVTTGQRLVVDGSGGTVELAPLSPTPQADPAGKDAP